MGEALKCKQFIKFFMKKYFFKVIIQMIFTIFTYIFNNEKKNYKVKRFNEKKRKKYQIF